jgi:hypothetical protein
VDRAVVYPKESGGMEAMEKWKNVWNILLVMVNGITPSFHLPSLFGFGGQGRKSGPPIWENVSPGNYCAIRENDLTFGRDFGSKNG